jgi:hypothetical protein
MMITSLDKGIRMGGRVHAVIRIVIAPNHAHDPLTIPNAARHPPLMAVHYLWRATGWKIGIYPRRLMPTTTELALRQNTRKIGMTSKLRRGMYVRRAGTMSWRWRLNATTWMLNSDAETRRIGLSLLSRGMLRFLGSHFQILRRHHLSHSSPGITNTHRPSHSLVLQRPACFPSQIQFIPIHHRLFLFRVLICVRCPASPCCLLCYLYRKNEKGGNHDEEED